MERMHARRLQTLSTLVILVSITCIAPEMRGASVQKDILHDLGTSFDISPGDTSIQETINHAPPNATLHLAAGLYTEILTINTPLHLLGEGAPHTILNPTSSTNGYAIRILAEGVTLSGLDISNQAEGLYTTGIKISAANTTVQNCSFHDTPIGIAIWSSQNTITGCDFTSCTDEGIALLGASTSECTQNTITSCNFQANCDGIELQYATHTRITSCTFTQNTHAGIDAITTHNTNNTISQCTFHYNQGFGLYLAGSSGTLVTHCSFSDDTITLVHATETIFLKNQVHHITLLEESSLRIEQCGDIVPSDIISQQSSYEIHPDQPELLPQGKNSSPATQHLLLTVLSRFTFLKSLYEQLLHLRM
jgi:parallel beta-helix repeat protein